MDIEAITQLLQEHFPGAEIQADFEGSHLQLNMVSDVFTGLTPLKKQKMVYAVLNDKIASGEIHAVHMKLQPPS